MSGGGEGRGRVGVDDDAACLQFYLSFPAFSCVRKWQMMACDRDMER